MTHYHSFRRWSLALLFAAFCLPRIAAAEDTVATSVQLDPPVKSEVSGKFLGDGKPAAVKYILVEEREEFSDKPAIRLIFSEKNPATVKKPSTEAVFGKLGSSLILSVFYDGDIFGCEVAHSAHSKSGFSELGQIKMLDFKMEGGNISGHVSTGGTLDAFGQKWEVDLTFAAPLPEKMRAAKLLTPKTATQQSASAPSEKADEPAEAVIPSPTISARSLPLPKDASNLQYKTVVQQIQLTSGQPVAAVTSELSASLKGQGWKETPGSLQGPRNAILKREQGTAKLTIMIQPASGGSTVKIFTEGLDWDDIETTHSTPANNAADPVNDAQKEAQDAIKDALKGLPTGF